MTAERALTVRQVADEYPGDGPIKIGFAQDVALRLYDLQIAHWMELHLVARLRGGRIIERHLHQRFAADRIAREWFRPTEAILAVTVALAAEDKFQRGRSRKNLPKRGPSE